MRPTGQSSGFKTWWVTPTNTSDSVWSRVLTRHLPGTWLSKRAGAGQPGRGEQGWCFWRGWEDRGIADLTLTVLPVRAGIDRVLPLFKPCAEFSLLVSTEYYELDSALYPIWLWRKLRLYYIQYPAHGHHVWRRPRALWGLQGWDKGRGEPTSVQGWPPSGLMICHLDCLLKSLAELCKHYRCLSQFSHDLWGWCSAILDFKSVLVTGLCLTLCDPTDFRPPGSSVHGILQARTLERFAIPFSRVSSQPRDQT